MWSEFSEPADFAKSYLLSTQFDVGEEDFGTSNDELLTISDQIRRGQYKFDPDDVQRHLTGYQEFKKSTPTTLIVDLIKWIGPPFLVLAAVLGLIFWTG